MEIETSFYSNGVPLLSTINIPDSAGKDNRKYPTVILCHGHSRDRNDGLDRLAEVLGEKGFASIRFDFRGCGKNAVNRYNLYVASEMPDDILNALSFAESLPFVDADRIGIAGISMGAILAVLVGGSGDDRIKSIVAMSGMADCEKGLKAIYERKDGDWTAFLARIKEDGKIAAATGSSQLINRLEMYNESGEARKAGIMESLQEQGNNGYLTLQSVASFLRVKPIEKCESIKCPIFFIHGEEDELIPPKNSELMYEKAGTSSKKLKIYKGVNHNIPVCKEREIVFKDIAAWLISNL